jgi:hypothetical protein
LASSVSELADDVVSLSENFAAWHLLAHPEERAKYAKAISRYSAFFSPTTVAHFQCVAVSIYQLTDPRADTLSVRQVLDETRTLCPAVVAEIEERLSPSFQIFDRISSIRHKVYAHRDKNAAPEMVFRVANLTPELIGSCVSLLVDAVDSLAAQFVPGCVAGSVMTRATRAADLTTRDLRLILAAL